WLAAPGSLTARLRLHGAVSVVVLDQGTRKLWPQERQALGCSVGHVREVVLHIDGRAAVWARSTVSVRAVKGPWRAIRGLGTRPLAELLFSHHAVRRGPLCGLVLPSGGPAHRHLGRQWQQIAPTPPRWARHSLFHHHGQRLQVLEAFAPWVSKLSCIAR
ncbi:MAG: chorismate lyase, partial [Burkholderiales bacterium]|nr:chorismate lyase [Burkholderiales bacterium]